MSTTAVNTAVELLHFPGESPRSRDVLAALAAAAPSAGVELVAGDAYRGGASWLLLWGPGAPNRFAPMRQQLAAGGHVIVCDLAYWDRHRKFRVSIDAAHPQACVMKRALPDSRLRADGLRLEHTWNPEGPVVIAGIGEKAAIQYGAVVTTFEAQMIAEARARGRRVIYRPKKTGAIPPGVDGAQFGPIESVLRGASLVVTWHSNVAIDAIRLGIPVICRDGAAAAVCSSTWATDLQPLPDAWRERFLANLAWFQWAPAEAPACWAFLREALS